jgi:hypothetical protein
MSSDEVASVFQIARVYGWPPSELKKLTDDEIRLWSEHARAILK